MKHKHTQLPRETPSPINLIVPSTIPQKMEAIVNLSRAITTLAAALESTNVAVTISNNHLTGGGITIAPLR